MHAFSLEQSIDEHGVFWHPNSSDHQVDGRLVYQPFERLTAQLTRPLIPGHIFGPISRVPATIFGQLANGRPITLFKTFVTRQGNGSGGKSPVEILANGCVIGAHVGDAEQDAIDSLTLRFTAIEEWFNESVFKFDGGERSHSVHYTSPEPLTVKLPLIRSTFETKYACGSEYRLTATRLEHVASWRLTFESPISLTQAKRHAWQLQNFYALLVGQPIASTRLTFKATQGRWATGDAPGIVDWIAVQRGRPREKELHSFQMFLPLTACRDQFGLLLHRWFEIVEAAKPSLNIYFGTLYQPPPVQDLRFLAFMQALEAYHRALGSGLYMPEGDYEALLPGMLNAIPASLQASHRRSLASRLRYGNEYSLRKRLKLLMQGLPSAVSAAIVNGAPGFVDRAVDTRNLFTHYSEADPTAVYGGQNIYFAAERLRVLYALVLLHAIGVREADLVRIIQENDQTQFVLGHQLL